MGESTRRDAYTQATHNLIISFAEIPLLLARSSYLFHVFLVSTQAQEVEVHLVRRYLQLSTPSNKPGKPRAPGLHLAGDHQSLIGHQKLAGHDCTTLHTSCIFFFIAIQAIRPEDYLHNSAHAARHPRCNPPISRLNHFFIYYFIL